MAWIESHQELAAHPKTLRFARLLGESIPTVIGRLHLLWWWALSYAQDGDLSGFEDQEIATPLLWTGDPATLRQALIGSGFLNPDGCIHDWEDYAGRLIVKRQANRDRARKAYELSTHSLRAENKSLQIVCEATVPNPTVPNRTEQNRTLEVVTETVELATVKPVTPNGKARDSEASASSSPAKQPSQPLQPYESAFLELFEFRSGRYPTKAMRSLVQGMVDKYGDGEFLAAAKIAAERNVRKLPYVEGILKKGGASAKPANIGAGRGRGPDNRAVPGKYAHLSG